MDTKEFKWSENMMGFFKVIMLFIKMNVCVFLYFSLYMKRQEMMVEQLMSIIVVVTLFPLHVGSIA